MPSRFSGQLPRRVRIIAALFGVAILIGAGWLDGRLAGLTAVGVGILVWLLLFCSPREAFARAWFAGFLSNLISFFWAPGTIAYSMGLGLPASVILFVLLALFESLHFGVFGYLVARFIARFPGRLWMIPCYWVALEFAIPKVFPWKIGYSLEPYLPLLQVAEITGASGVSLMFMSAVILPSLFFWRWKTKQSPQASKQDQSDGKIGLQMIGLSLYISACVVFGFYRVYFDQSFTADVNPLKVAIVQVNPMYGGSEDILQERSIEVGDTVDLICWPESSLGSYQSNLTAFHNDLEVAIKSREPMRGFRPLPNPPAFLLAAGKTYGENALESGPYHVTAFLIDKEEAIVGSYHKISLMPLGEYVPGQRWYPKLRQLANIEYMIVPGTSVQPIELNENVRLGILICYEDTVSANSRHTVSAGANILVALINASAFEHPVALMQHKRLAQMRSIENRRYLLRCSATGISCSISPLGKTLAATDCNTEETLIARVQPVNDLTIYTRCGDLLSPLCLLLTCVSILITLRHDRLCRAKVNPQ